jgi:very-short-patch-repair endonuclease
LVRIKGGWVKAEDIQKGDKVRILADECPQCGKRMPFFKKWCSHTCQSRAVTEMQWSDPDHRRNLQKKISQSMNRQYRLGLRDADKGLEAAHASMHRRVAKGIFALQRPDIRRKIKLVTNTPEMRKASSLRMKLHNPMAIPEVRARAAKSLRRTLMFHPERSGNAALAKKGFVSSLERKMATLLDKIGLKYIQQKSIGPYFADFALPQLRIVIECDGEYWHAKSKEKGQIRQRVIEAHGWMVLRYTGTQINKCLEEVESEILRVVGNHQDKYLTMDAEIVKVEHWKVRKARQLWNLSVDEDESYIVNGFVVHNCRCALIPVVDVEGVN